MSPRVQLSEALGSLGVEDIVRGIEFTHGENGREANVEFFNLDGALLLTQRCTSRPPPAPPGLQMMVDGEPRPVLYSRSPLGDDEATKGDEIEDRSNILIAPPPFSSSSSSSYIFDARSGFFYEPASCFFYDPQSSLYYSTSLAKYFSMSKDGEMEEVMGGGGGGRAAVYPREGGELKLASS